MSLKNDVENQNISFLDHSGTDGVAGKNRDFCEIFAIFRLFRLFRLLGGTPPPGSWTVQQRVSRILSNFELSNFGNLENCPTTQGKKIVGQKKAKIFFACGACWGHLFMHFFVLDKVKKYT